MESIAPLQLQESYDNSGLITGNLEQEIKGVLVALDCIEKVLDEAIELGANVVVAHHPIVFSGLKKITGRNYIERTIIKAIKHDIAIYAIHTNLDNVIDGVNGMFARRLGLVDCSILSPKKDTLAKLVTFVPLEKEKEVRSALFEAGAGHIGNYDSCSFNVKGTGTFKPGEDTNAYVGEKGKLHCEEEIRVEMIFPTYKKGQIVKALVDAHPYEEVAYDIYKTNQLNPNVGSGLIGELEKSLPWEVFLKFLKKEMQTDCIRYTNPVKDEIKRVALCGGSGSFLLNDAIAKKADVFITGDFKYHQFFDADEKILIADIGHFESEQFTSELLVELLREKFVTFAIHLTRIITNPVNYI